MEASAAHAQFANFGGGDVFSLTGTHRARVHRIPSRSCCWASWPSAFPALAIAGERDRGTLEVTLSRPISRRGLLATLFVAGPRLPRRAAPGARDRACSSRRPSSAWGPSCRSGNLAQLWLAAWLLFVAFMSLAFAVSVSVGPGRAGRRHPGRVHPRQLPGLRHRLDLAGHALAAGLLDVQPAEGAARAELRAGPE